MWHKWQNENAFTWHHNTVNAYNRSRYYISRYLSKYDGEVDMYNIIIYLGNVPIRIQNISKYVGIYQNIQEK